MYFIFFTNFKANVKVLSLLLIYPSFDFILSRQKEPEILCLNLSTVLVINPKYSLWENLLSILVYTISKSDLASAIEAAFDLKRIRSLEFTSYLFILTDGLFQENEY